jgi:hypothetical protein
MPAKDRCSESLDSGLYTSSIFELGYASTMKEVTMNPLKLVRIAGLGLVLSLTALTTFAQPSAQPCSCNLCMRSGTGRSCTWEGSTITCGEFLSFTTCQAQG